MREKGYNEFLTRREIASNKKEITENEKTYKDNIEAYKEYLEKIAFLVKTLSVPNNSISSSVIVRNLVDAGTFSQNMDFSFRDDLEQIKGFEDMSIIKGLGSDKNICLFNAKILHSLNQMSDVFYAHSAFKDDLDYIYGKRIINLIEFKDNLYGYDSVKDSLYCFIHDGVMMEMFKKRPNYLMYDWYSDILYNDASYESTVALKDLYDKYKNRRLISLDDYQGIHKLANGVTYDSPLLMKDFNNSTKKYIRRITDNMK